MHQDKMDTKRCEALQQAHRGDQAVPKGALVGTEYTEKQTKGYGCPKMDTEGSGVPSRRYPAVQRCTEAQERVTGAPKHALRAQYTH